MENVNERKIQDEAHHGKLYIGDYKSNVHHGKSYKYLFTVFVETPTMEAISSVV